MTIENSFNVKHGLKIANSITVSGISNTTLTNNDNQIVSEGQIYRELSAKTDVISFTAHTADTSVHHTISELNNLYVNVTGDTINGDLIVTGTSTLNSVVANTITGTTMSAGTLSAENIVEIDIDSLVYKSGSTMTGTLYAPSVSATTISADTYYSGSTNLLDIFATSSNIPIIQNGLNTYTGGTNVNPTVNISAATLSTLIVTGNTELNGQISSSPLSGTTDRMVQASTGGTISAQKTIIEGFLSTSSTTQTLLSASSGWTANGLYTGTTLVDVYQGQQGYDDNYHYIFVANNLPIRTPRA